MQVKGINGISVLYLHPFFDLANGPVLDSLHCIYLGVVKTLLNLWFEGRGHPYYIGDKVGTFLI